jgi:peptidoglycan hydrolase-like protein with peptidoglycan-binding domain
MAVKGSVEAIIEVAKKEIGTIEGPKDNETKYGKWSGVNFQPWCQSFVSWCAFTSGLDAKKYPKTASTVAAADYFKKNNRWADARNDDPTPGDWIFFDFPDDGVNRISHVGLCIKNNGDGTIQVIEGNTSGTAKGDQRNGGMCVEKTRAYVKHKTLMNAVVGWGRPVYAGEENLPLLSKSTAAPAPTAKPVAKKPVAKKPASKVIKIGAKGSGVKTIQELLGIKADGEFGPGTAAAVKKFQSKNGLKPSGVVDTETLEKLKGAK